MITTGFLSPILDPALGLLDIAGGIIPRAIDPVVLPDDERAHTYPIEWWYLTGHLATTPTGPTSDPFGFEVTVVRVADPLLGVGLEMLAFFSLVDIRRRQYVAFDRTAGIDAYATTTDGFRVDLPAPADEVGGTTWSLESTPDPTDHATYALDFRTPTVGLQLTVDGGKPAVLHGDAGVIDFGGDFKMGYYSRTRIDATGTVNDGSGDRAVAGTVWMDHQWGPARFIGRRWKFFAIQLDTGDELIVYQIWRRGFPDPLATIGSRIDAAGVATPIDSSAITIVDAGAPLPGGYPVHNRITLGDTPATELLLVPYFADQERRAVHPHALYPAWWEGACTVEGTVGGSPVTGKAYTELAGWNVAIAGVTD
jgi:predicted secreted hydrolase